MHNRKGTHADVEVFEDELKQMQAMELVKYYICLFILSIFLSIYFGFSTEPLI